MAVAVVADAHLGGPGGEAAPLLEQLAALPEQGCDRLVLLGDLFQYWVGHRRYETADQRAVADVLRALRGQGIAVDYVEGNRDFFLARGPQRDAFDRVALEARFTVGERRCLALHGDGIDRSDRPYLFWRWLSKNACSRFFWFHLPRALAQRLATAMEARLSRTNYRHKVQIPEETVLRFARSRLREGFELVLFGHFHEPRRWTTGDGEIRLVEAWFRSRRVEWLRG